MSEFKRMPKMATSEPTVTLALKGGGPVKKAMGGNLPTAPMKAPMAPRRPSPDASMGKPMMDDNTAARSMKQKMMMRGMPAMKKGGKVADKAMGGMIGNRFSPKANQVIPLMAKQALPTTSGNLQLPAKMPGKMMANPPMRPPIAGGNMAGMLNKLRPGMKKGGKAGDMAQDKAMIKKAFKQHDMQEHKGDKGTDLKLKKGGKMAMGGSVDTAQNMPNRLGSTGGVPARQGGYKKGGAVETGSINTNTTKMVTTAGKAPLGKFKDGGSVGSYANTKMMTAENLRQKLGKSGDVKIGAAGYKKGGMVKDMC